MFHVLNGPNSRAYRVNTKLITYVESWPSLEDERVMVEIRFSGDTKLSLTLDTSVWENFLRALQTETEGATR